MSVFQNMNQFEQTPIKGSVDSLLTPNTVSVQLNVLSDFELIPGDAVKLVSGDAKVILVDKCGDSDKPFGFVLFNPKKERFEPGDTFEIMLDWSVMFMEAGGVISRGNNVEFVSATTQVIASGGGNPISGVALDNAVEGDIFRVLIKVSSISGTGFSIENFSITSEADQDEFVLPSTPVPGRLLLVYIDGVFQSPESGDYTITGDTITFNEGLTVGRIVSGTYEV